MKSLLLPLALSLILLAGCAQQNVAYKPVLEPTTSQLGVDSKARSASQAVVSNDTTNEKNQPLDASLTPVSALNVWQKIASTPGFANNISNNEIEKYRNWYTGRQPYFNDPGTRARLYLAHIIEEFESHQLPLELALLPFVESAFNPFAVSPSGAAGLWQFMPPTGDHLGLKRDQWYDGRRDIISSTDAAIRYFKYLNKRFDGDWLLTLAAYNAGEGTVSKAIRANLRQGSPADFWSLRLPRQTKAYVPKLIALAQVIASPSDHQLTLPNIPTQIYFDVVELPQQIGLYQVSLMAEMSLENLYRLNPGYQQSITPPEGPHRVLIPKHKTQSFTLRLSDKPKNNWLDVFEYQVQPGDTLGEIAQRHGLKSQSLMTKNNMKSSHLRVGQTLKIPSTQSANIPSFARPTQYYHVRRGDSLWKIAKTYQVKTHDLAHWNDLRVKAPLRIGRRLVIRAPAPTRTQKRRSYTIKKGDSLSLISKQFNVSISDIVRWNKINPRGTIKAGQTLRLFPRS